MIGEVAIGAVITGLIQTHKLDKWGRLLIGCALSGTLTFAFVWGSGALGHIASGTVWPLSLAMGFCEGLVASAAVVFFKFRRDPLTKGVSISVPAGVEAAEQEILRREGITTVNPKG